MRADFRSKGPELLIDLAEHTAQALIELAAMEREHAEQLGREIAGRMAAHWGGQNLYFPKGQSYKLSQRDRQIYAEFIGDNQSELARKYSVSLQWVYKIIKAVHREEVAKRQGKLFPDESEAR
jgi:Mor family transcriptional regulator